MPSRSASSRPARILIAGVIAALLMPSGILPPPSALAQQSSAASEATPKPPQAPIQDSVGQPPPQHERSIFQKLVPPDQLAFLSQFAGSASGEVIRDKQYRKLMKIVIPNCIFHYGWDMSLQDALAKVLDGSQNRVQIREQRYVIVSGQSGPYLAGRGFMWIDMQEGIALGGFYFHPTNGEPTPTVTIFSAQVKENALRMTQLPSPFAEVLRQWSAESGVPPITTRYLIGGLNRKILLEHDEDYCALPGTSGAPSEDCDQMNYDAADIDLTAIYYLNQTNHATNATEWMITGPDLTSWIQFRNNTCRSGPESLRCRIRLTRERTHTVLNQQNLAHR